jgi:hypothetical protein
MVMHRALAVFYHTLKQWVGFSGKHIETEIYLWLDDERKPPSRAVTGIRWTWAKSHDQAIVLLKTGRVVFASLDHDLCDEHYQAFSWSVANNQPVDTTYCGEKTGYETLCWMEEHKVWPKNGVRIHSMNTIRKPIMVEAIKRIYGRTFQFQMKGSHSV